MDTVSELTSFLRPDSKPELKIATVEHLTGLTATADGREVFKCYPPLLEALACIVQRKEMPFARDALTCFVNLAAEETTVDDLLACNVLTILVESLGPSSDYDPTCIEKICMTLSNMTRSEAGSQAFVGVLRSKGSPTLSDLVDTFCGNDREGSRQFNFISTVLGNVTQLADGRSLVMDRSKRILQRLLPYLGCYESAIRRRGIACLVKNCCFNTEHHTWLLGDEIDILPHLLLPLAGPEEFEEDDMEKLPVDLQYLGDDKTRESEADIRIMLLESIMQLCAAKLHRQYIKSKNTYIIIRELHKQETDPSVSQKCETLISVLIADEPEEGMENLQEVSIPPEIAAQLSQQDSSS